MVCPIDTGECFHCHQKILALGRIAIPCHHVKDYNLRLGNSKETCYHHYHQNMSIATNKMLSARPTLVLPSTLQNKQMYCVIHTLLKESHSTYQFFSYSSLQWLHCHSCSNSPCFGESKKN